MFGQEQLKNVRLLASGRLREERYGQLMREHGAGISRVISSYARGNAERDDLAQEVGIAIWRALDSFRGECSERTFIFRIAHNQCLTWACRRRAHDNLDDVEEPFDAAPNPELSLDRHQQQEHLLRAVRSLPVAFRQVLTLALEEMSHDEMADVLGITKTNVAVRLNRAKEALRNKLGGSP
jgi:RNA polymerase sigma-70 factor (ECF subfamily)